MSAPSDDAELVRTVVASVAHQIDGKRWDDLRMLFALEVRTDYTSLFGGSPETQSRESLVDKWRGTLGKVATQHLLGPTTLRITGAQAHASCHVRALHRASGAPGGETWEVLGHYEMTLARAATTWEITGLTLHTFVQTGNARLLEEAGSSA
jgi:hypothetical protein